MTIFSFKYHRSAVLFWVMAFYIALLALTGGGARADIESLVILRPLSVLVCGWAIWGLTWEEVRPFRFAVFFLLALIALTGLHLVPLPVAIWNALPGRDVLVEIDKVAGIGAVWRPISIVPSQTWNALFSFIVPLTTLVLMLRMTREQRFNVMLLILIVGLLSGIVGLLQAIGPQDGPLYLYRYTNNGAAVGLFANRNHQAAMLACLFPMLALFASSGLNSIEQARFRAFAAIAAGVVLVPLLLVTGSRAGVFLGILGLVAAAVLYRQPKFSKPAKRKVHRFNPRYLIVGAAIFGLIALTILTSRAQALERLFASDGIEDLRLAIWPSIFEMALKYFPVGSGIGTFVETYQIDEPARLLSQNYVNHAHNDWLELLLTGGAAALLLASVAVLSWARGAWLLFRASDSRSRDVMFGRLGALMIFMLGMASVADYPLRAPALSANFIVALVWMCNGYASLRTVNRSS